MPRARDQEIVIPQAEWRAARTSHQFIDLARLARATNALAMAYPVLMIPIEYQSPRARRDRTAAFIYTGGVLVEGLKVSRSLGKHFRNLPQYRSGFGAIHADKGVQALERRFLQRLRDKAAFHFEREVFVQALPELEYDPVRLASARGFSAGAIYFDFVDDATLVYLTGAKSDEEHLRLLEEYMVGTAQLANRFLRAAHSLIPRVLREFGGKKRSLKIVSGAA